MWIRLYHIIIIGPPRGPIVVLVVPGSVELDVAARWEHVDGACRGGGRRAIVWVSMVHTRA